VPRHGLGLATTERWVGRSVPARARAVREPIVDGPAWKRRGEKIFLTVAAEATWCWGDPGLATPEQGEKVYALVTDWIVQIVKPEWMESGGGAKTASRSR
jgi:creatinine amidohydrolase/Fe(II)-dependent formamide hydrolase-like protein